MSRKGWRTSFLTQLEFCTFVLISVCKMKDYERCWTKKWSMCTGAILNTYILNVQMVWNNRCVFISSKWTNHVASRANKSYCPVIFLFVPITSICSLWVVRQTNATIVFSQVLTCKIRNKPLCTYFMFSEEGQSFSEANFKNKPDQITFVSFAKAWMEMDSFESEFEGRDSEGVSHSTSFRCSDGIPCS